jgi:glucuronate isomerase
MKPFINEDFLLGNKTAKRLFYDFSANQPLIDFHCHLSPAMIAEDYQFDNLGEAWLEGDHYKWRAMRANGIEEKYCTGNALFRDKFAKWAETVPATIGNPLYHWTHLELARYFEIYDLLSPATCKRIYNETSSMLKSPEYSTRSLITRMNVEVICTTDDPVDSLEHHRKLKGSFRIPVLPTFRPDNLLKTEDPAIFRSYIEKLGNASGIEVRNITTLHEAVDNRHRFFHDHGCRLSDHGLKRFYFDSFTEPECEKIFSKLLKGEKISSGEDEKYKTAILLELCRMNHKRGWTQQFHTGALRNTNTRMLRLMGPDTGWDSIGVPQDAEKISGFLNALDDSDQLAETILYNNNPADNSMMITMSGNFNDGSRITKTKYGAAWWFLDQKYGMEQHLKDVSSLGLLRRFVGMVTDSRSFLSYPRHEYFRRLLCNFVGSEIEKGLIPGDDELIKPLIEGASYKNAKEFLGLSN